MVHRGSYTLSKQLSKKDFNNSAATNNQGKQMSLLLRKSDHDFDSEKTHRLSGNAAHFGLKHRAVTSVFSV